MEHNDQFEKIKLLSEIALRDFDWRKLKQELLSSQNVNLGWYYQYNNNGILEVCQYGCDDNETRFPDCVIGSEYLSVEFTSRYDGNKKYFWDIVSSALEIEDIVYVGINFLSPGMEFTPHVDTGEFTVLINIETNDKCILQVDNKDYTFKNGDIFIFDGDLTHAVYNHSNSVWTNVVLRIKKPTTKNNYVQDN
jgi:hypothetical protein